MTEHISEKDKQINRERIEHASKGVFGFFIRRRKVTLVVTIMLVIWGAFALLSLPREANPEVKIPFGIVATVWSGASPDDVEDLVTDEIETKIKNLENVKEITSSSSNSISTVSVEFNADADLDKSIRKLRDAVDTVTGLPDEAMDPRVIEIGINDDAIVSFSLLSDLSEVELKDLAETVQEEIESINGVSEAQIVGARDREWRVNLDPAKLNQFSISASDVTRAIATSNINFPLGQVEIEKENFAVRSVAKIETLEMLGSVVIKNTPSGTILLRDVADINDQLVEQKTISRLATKGEASRQTVSLQVFKQTGGNIIHIVDSAKDRLEVLKSNGTIPENVEIVVTNDLSKFVRDDFSTLSRSGVQTLILIFVALALVLALRMAFIAVLSIPIIFLASFGIIDMQGSTLNSLTLFSLILSLGLLIDTTIILLEGIYEGVSKGYSSEEAALLSVDMYKWPIIAGVLTTISAFVPMFLVSGIVGEFLRTLPLTISAVLGSSLFVGLLIMPALSTYFIKPKNNHTVERNHLQQLLHDFAVDHYRPAITSLLNSKKQRRKLYIGITVAFLLCMSLLFTGVIKTELFPAADLDFFIVNVELPQGSVLEETDAVVRQVETKVAEIDELKNYLVTVGRSASFGIGSSDTSNEHLASIIVNLEEERDRKSFEVTEELREQFKSIDGARIEIEDIEGGPPTDDPIAMQVRGDDLTELSAISTQIKSELSSIEGVYDIISSDKPSPPQFVFKLDHEVLGKFNVSALQVSQELRAALFGLDAGTVTVDGNDLDIVVQFDEADVATIEEIKNIEITNLIGERIKVSQVADVRIEPALQTIQHKDLERTVFITAKNKDRDIRSIQNEISKKVDSMHLPKGYRIVQGGEFQDQTQAFTDLYKAMVVAVVLILFIMIVQFNSYKQPLIILLTLPLAFIGVIFGTFVFHMPFGFSTFLGIVALGGIVVNDAIVLIDRINFNVRVRHMEINEALIEAGDARLQPILLTTTTTALGVIPLAFADEFWRGLSVAIAVGIIFATGLTLFVIPLLYRRFEYKTYRREQPQDIKH